MKEHHEKRLAVELRKARTKAFLVNTALIYYFLFVATALGNYLVDANDELTIASTVSLALLAPALLLGALWTLSLNSLGSLIVIGTDPFLKKNIRTPESHFLLTVSK